MAKPRRKGASKQLLILLVGGFFIGVAGIAFYFVYQASLDVSKSHAAIDTGPSSQLDDGTEMSPATRAKVADATVIVRVKNGKTVTLGSGFFCRRGIVVTDVDVLGEIPDVQSFSGSLEVVLNAGVAGKETVCPAKLTVLDPYSRLAFIKPDGLKLAPEPLDLGSTQFVGETTPLFVAQCTPSATKPGEGDTVEIAKCAVSHSEFRKSGTQVLIVEGAFGQACGGAPVLNQKGQLLALIPHHKKALNSSATVPLADVTFSINGYVSDLSVKTRTKNGDRYTFDISANCIDPLDVARGVTFYYWTAGEGNANPTAKTAVALTRVGNTSTWKGSVSDLVVAKRSEFWAQTGFKAGEAEVADAAFNRAAELGVPGAQPVVVEAPRPQAPRYVPPPQVVKRVVVQQPVAPPPPPDSPGWNLGYTTDQSSNRPSGDYETKGNSWDNPNKSVSPVITRRR